MPLIEKPSEEMVGKIESLENKKVGELEKAKQIKPKRRIKNPNPLSCLKPKKKKLKNDRKHKKISYFFVNCNIIHFFIIVYINIYLYVYNNIIFLSIYRYYF